ncbi:MAG: hemolysin family protein [Caldisericum sp.]
MSSLGLSIILIIVLLFFSAIFTMLESAMFNSSLLRIQTAAKRNFIYKLILEHKKRPENFISAVVIGNNFVNFLISALITNIAVIYSNKFGFSNEIVILLATITTTLIVVIFGETVPKTIGSTIPEKSLGATFTIFLPFYYILKPFAFILSKISEFILFIFGIKAGEKRFFESEDEVISMIELGKREGLIEHEEEKMIYSIFEFGDTIVKEIMTPRVDIVAIEIESDLDEILDIITKSGHSRLPVYEEKIDNVIGILYVKDLLKVIAKKEKPDIRKILRAPFFVPETKRVDELFKEMQKNKIQIALVFDEYGGVSGLVTIEDILEEIVGEIQDEFDIEEKPVQRLDDNAYLISGAFNIDDFNEMFNVQLSGEEASTIGGLLLEHFGRLPNPGEEIIIDNVKFIVSKVRNRRIVQVKVIFVEERKEGETNEKE